METLLIKMFKNISLKRDFFLIGFIVIISIVISYYTSYYPIAVLILFVIIPSILILFNKFQHITIRQVLFYLFIAAIISSILGPFASLEIIIQKYGQVFLYRVLLFTLFFLFIVTYLFKKDFSKLVYNRLKTLNIKFYLYFLVVWFLFLLLSILWAADLSWGVRYCLLFLCSVFTTILIPIVINKTINLKYLFYALTLLFLIALFLGFLELIGLRPPFLVLSYERLIRVTPSLANYPEQIVMQKYMWSIASFFGNQNNYATYIVLFLPFLLISFTYLKKLYQRSIISIILLLSLVSLIAIASRSSIVAASIGIIVTMFLVGKINYIQNIKTVGYFTIISLVLILPVVIYLYSKGFFSEIALLKLLRLKDLINSGIGEGRMSLLTTSLDIIFKNPFFILFGLAAGNHHYYLEGLITHDLLSLHNWWLEVFVDGGIFIFIAYNIFYFSILKNLYIIMKESSCTFIKFLSQGLFVSFISFIPASITCSTVLFFTPIWINWGLALAIINIYRLNLKKHD